MKNEKYESSQSETKKQPWTEKRWGWWVLGALFVAMLLTHNPEGNSSSTSKAPQVTQGMKREARSIINSAGFSCGSVNKLLHLNYRTKTTFSVSCDNYSYMYEIVDYGGNWVVKVQ